MESRIKLIFAILLTVCVGCEENLPVYRLERPIPGERKILVEEFTGVRCPNCPEGSLELENLKSIYGDNLIIISVHAGDFVFPYENSKFNFETEVGNRLLNLLGNPVGYPSAVINRKLFRGETNYQLFASKWVSRIEDESSISSIVNLNSQIQYDSVNRQVNLEFEILPLQDIDHALYLGVMIIENNITDVQADRMDPDGIVDLYVHNHVLRDMLTDPDGTNLGSSFDQFGGLTRPFEFVLPQGDGWWKATDIRIVAFISKPAETEEASIVIQAGEWKLF